MKTAPKKLAEGRKLLSEIRLRACQSGNTGKNGLNETFFDVHIPGKK